MLDFIWRRHNDIVNKHSILSPRKAKDQLKNSYQAYKQAWEEKLRVLPRLCWLPLPWNHWSFSFDAIVRDTFSTSSTICYDYESMTLAIESSKINSTNPIIVETSTTLLAVKLAKHLQKSTSI